MMYVNTKRVFLEEYIIWQLILVQSVHFSKNLVPIGSSSRDNVFSDSIIHHPFVANTVQKIMEPS